MFKFFCMIRRGKVELVKLLAGRFSLSPNLRSRGGYTPLMMAGMGKCYEVSIEEQG